MQRGTRRGTVATIKALLLGALAAVGSLAPPAEAIELNICEVLVEDLVIPPQFEEIRECTRDWKRIFIMPHCALPSCIVHPECVVTQTVLRTAEVLVRAGEVHCHVQDLSPEALFEKWRRGKIANAVEVLLNAVPIYPEFRLLYLDYIEQLATSGQSLPLPVRQILHAIAARGPEVGLESFTPHDVDNIKIISFTAPEAAPVAALVPAWSGAITLGPVVVIQEEDFQALVGATGNEVTLPHLLAVGLPAPLVQAIDLMVHELIHVRQYRELGLETFVKNYLPETLAVGYGSDSFEREAYTFTATMADVHEGLWCSEMREVHDSWIEEFELALEPLTCTAYLEPITPILLGMM
jgi:hypothetical protein